jgi:hypothetical protein
VREEDQRPTQNSNSYLEHLQRCSVCDPTKIKSFSHPSLSYFLSFFQPHQQHQNRLGLPVGERLLTTPIQYKGSFNTNNFFKHSLIISSYLKRNIIFWSLLKGPEVTHYLGHFFFSSKSLITLERMQVSFILSRVIVVDLATTSWLSPLQDTPPITTADLLQAIDFWHVNMTDLPQVVDYEHEKIFTTTLSQLDLMSLRPFPSFHSFLYVSLIYSVFFLVKLSRNLLRI